LQIALASIKGCAKTALLSLTYPAATISQRLEQRILANRGPEVLLEEMWSDLLEASFSGFVTGEALLRVADYPDK